MSGNINSVQGSNQGGYDNVPGGGKIYVGPAGTQTTSYAGGSQNAYFAITMAFFLVGQSLNQLGQIQARQLQDQAASSQQYVEAMGKLVNLENQLGTSTGVITIPKSIVNMFKDMGQNLPTKANLSELSNNMTYLQTIIQNNNQQSQAQMETVQQTLSLLQTAQQAVTSNISSMKQIGTSIGQNL